jgi:hypothetical protein
MSTFRELCRSLEDKIVNSYTTGVSLDEAEKLAAEFLYAQLAVSAELTKSGLDSRMKKSGLKAVRAAIYMDASTKGEKKPTEAALAALVDMNELVQGEQRGFDEAEIEADELERFYNIFREAHIFYRGIAKGSLG